MGPNTRPIRVALAALVLFVLVTAGTFAIVQARDATITSLNPAPTNTPGPPTTRGMMGNGMRGRSMMGRSNLSDPYDLRFLDEMIVHHEMAIGMVRASPPIPNCATSANASLPVSSNKSTR